MEDGTYLRVSIEDIIVVSVAAIAITILLLWWIKQGTREVLCKHEFKDMLHFPEWCIVNNADGYCPKCDRLLWRPTEQDE